MEPPDLMTDDRATTTDAAESGNDRTDAPRDDAPRGDGMEGCPKCTMRIRRSEMSIHLAHAHNIGPAGERRKKGGGGRRR